MRSRCLSPVGTAYQCPAVQLEAASQVGSPSSAPGAKRPEVLDLLLEALVGNANAGL